MPHILDQYTFDVISAAYCLANADTGKAHRARQRKELWPGVGGPVCLLWFSLCLIASAHLVLSAYCMPTGFHRCCLIRS